MDGTSFMSVDEVAQTLGVSKSYAYRAGERIQKVKTA